MKSDYDSGFPIVREASEPWNTHMHRIPPSLPFFPLFLFPYLDIK